MYTGKLVFAQLMSHLPLHTFRRCVARYGGDRKVQRFTCLDKYLCVAFAQLTYRESLRDIEACLQAKSNKLYHMGISGSISRSTLAAANLQLSVPVFAALGGITLLGETISLHFVFASLVILFGIALGAG